MGRSKTQVKEGVHLIKKYPNRKLYSVNNSHYVTLDDIGLYVINGEDVRVTDNATGEDISGEILLQVLMEREKAYAAKSANTYMTILREHKQLGELV